MKRLRQKAPLVAALLLLMSVGTASAECAWMLWLNTELTAATTSSEWGIAQAFPTRQDCLIALRRTFDSMKTLKTTNIDLIEGGAFTIITGDRAASTAGKCLPDTIDPRGPKPK